MDSGSENILDRSIKLCQTSSVDAAETNNLVIDVGVKSKDLQKSILSFKSMLSAEIAKPDLSYEKQTPVAENFKGCRDGDV